MTVVWVILLRENDNLKTILRNAPLANEPSRLDAFGFSSSCLVSRKVLDAYISQRRSRSNRTSFCYWMEVQFEFHPSIARFFFLHQIDRFDSRRLKGILRLFTPIVLFSWKIRYIVYTEQLP